MYICSVDITVKVNISCAHTNRFYMPHIGNEGPNEI